MKRWKKFIAMGLAVSMIVPSCIPQTLWASEFSAGSVESAADVFEDGAEYETGSESGNKISDENNSGDEFGTGELKDQEPERSETEDSVNAGQSAEGYNILLYSDGKLEKTYVIPYADADTAKVPEALKGKTGYIFKEWNTKEDGTGETYKPGDSIKKLLEIADMAKQAQETSERTEVGEEIKPEKDVMQEENDVAQTDSASWEEKTDKAEMQISDTENDGTSPDISTDKAIAAGDTTAITLYAIWEKASEYKITYKLNKGKNNTANPKTYTSEDEIKFKKPTRSGYHFVGWYTDSKYKNQISVIEKGSEGSLTLYAKWTKEISPSAKAASLDYVKGTKVNTITVSATVSNYVKSSDSYYYLVYVDSNSGKVKKMVGKVKKPEKAKGKITFKLNISGHPEYAQGKFAIGIKKSKSAYSVISPKSYVSNPEKLSTNTAAYFVPGTKKGIQATDINELTDTKSKTVFFNLYISDLMRKDSGVETYKYNGKTYHFNGLYGYVYLVQQCNAKGIQVTAQISIDRNASTQSFITGNSPYAETAYYGWNTDNSTTRQTMEAMFAYLGEKFGKNNCYISNWILGNEVNSASGYYYVGNVSFSKFISMYSEAFRCLYNAVKSSRGSSKVFICLDNCWNQKNAFTICYSARSTLESFAAKISDMQKDVNWNLAYHAYNQPLSDSQFWSGANASMFTSDANTTTFITMRNIQTLTDYVKNRFGSNTRIILSEQGFSSTYGGQANQAAAIALAYYKAACNPMIDAFIIRSYKDEAHEVAQGLAMGLKDANGKKKTAYNVFKNMDSSNSLKYTEKVLKSQVGNWKSLVPGYSTGKISSMYRK
ncbi:MAG: InlB B-repeat-containing protein [Blautia sp.]|nr:InlB B-repeat-containing protein [Blautia sp.]